jgi:hypothetical protein
MLCPNGKTKFTKNKILALKSGAIDLRGLKSDAQRED